MPRPITEHYRDHCCSVSLALVASSAAHDVSVLQGPRGRRPRQGKQVCGSVSVPCLLGALLRHHNTLVMLDRNLQQWGVTANESLEDTDIKSICQMRNSASAACHDSAQPGQATRIMHTHTQPRHTWLRRGLPGAVHMSVRAGARRDGRVWR